MLHVCCYVAKMLFPPERGRRFLLSGAWTDSDSLLTAAVVKVVDTRHH